MCQHHLMGIKYKLIYELGGGHKGSPRISRGGRRILISTKSIFLWDRLKKRCCPMETDGLIDWRTDELTDNKNVVFLKKIKNGESINVLATWTYPKSLPPPPATFLFPRVGPWVCLGWQPMPGQIFFFIPYTREETQKICFYSGWTTQVRVTTSQPHPT